MHKCKRVEKRLIMSRAKVLLVEDSKGQGQTTKEFLEKNGFEVIWAEDGVSVQAKGLGNILNPLCYMSSFSPSSPAAFW
jgi:response regulator RpfG family c-di-GMP phosphodiesterase